MAHSLSAKKRVRQSEKRNLRNKVRKERIKKVIRTFDDAIKAGKEEDINTSLIAAQRAIDKAKTKGLFHRKTADRKKARLALAANRAIAAPAS
jgi:small subunit ribosomal protein S20